MMVVLYTDAGQRYEKTKLACFRVLKSVQRRSKTRREHFLSITPNGVESTNLVRRAPRIINSAPTAKRGRTFCPRDGYGIVRASTDLSVVSVTSARRPRARDVRCTVAVAAEAAKVNAAASVHRPRRPTTTAFSLTFPAGCLRKRKRWLA